MSILLGILAVLTPIISTNAILTVSPSNVTVKVGSPATFQCTPQSTVGMLWIRYEPKVIIFNSNRSPNPINDSTKYSYNVTNNNYLFTVISPQLTDGAPYSFDDKFDLEETFVNLLVVATPVVSLTPSSGLAIGQSVNISCVVDYGGSTKDDANCPLSPDQELKLSIAIGSDTAYVQGGQGVLYSEYKTTADGVLPATRRRSLSVNMTLENQHGGQYVNCSVTSTKPYYSEYAQMVIPLAAAPSTFSLNATNTTSLNTGTYIICTAIGYPIPTVTWKAIFPSGCLNIIQGQMNSGYAVLNVSCSGLNIWNCTASNTNGQTWTSLTFYGRRAPSSLSINADNGTIWSSGAYINCSSDGFPIPNVIWEVVSPAGCVNSNHDQANGYAVLNVSCSGPNTWKCSASNYLGSLSKSLSFDVVKAPSFISINATERTNFVVGTNISCSSDGYPTPDVVWKVVTPTWCTSSTSAQTGGGSAILGVSCDGPNTWNCTASNIYGSTWKTFAFNGTKGYPVCSPCSGSASIQDHSLKFDRIHGLILVLSAVLLG